MTRQTGRYPGSDSAVAVVIVPGASGAAGAPATRSTNLFDFNNYSSFGGELCQPELR
jgi:hypothetical protein